MMWAHSLAVVFFSSLLVAGGEKLPDVPPQATLAPRALRGYGLTSAERWGDLTVIHAESEAKAKLWAARYLHAYASHVVGPGVVKFPDGTYSGLTRQGRDLFIRRSVARPSAWTEALPSIPKYLNCWDDWAFRFYYRPGQTPPDANGRATSWMAYDPEPEFDFASRCGCGFVFWFALAECDWAKGLLNDRRWNWAYDFACARGLPVVLNTSFAAQTWMMDAYRDENVVRAPGFLGGYHSVGDSGSPGDGFVDWSSTRARQLVLDQIAAGVSRYNTDDVIELLEPHGELNHGAYTVFLDYGPLADASFRTYLKEKWGTPAAVGRRWQESVTSWDDVHLPAIADFAGGGEGCIDLGGEWVGNTFAPDATEAPAAWMAETCDTRDWPIRLRNLPYHDEALFLPNAKTPGVLRRSFVMPEAGPGERTWLYVWDLSGQFKKRVAATVNGKTAFDERIAPADCHWTCAEVTDLIHAGTNTIAVQLASPKICYRVYLTHEEPRFYPHFRGGLNAKWADFCHWQAWSRVKAVERGIRTLRRVEPNKNIVAMAPGVYFNQMRELAKTYGTRFHDTGMTAACFWEYLPMLMRSADLPFSCEPGSPAKDLPGFRSYLNLYLQEGQNAVHYFIHVGDILWQKDIRDEFERVLPALRQMGRRRLERATVALLLDSDITALAGYPWRKDLRDAYYSGYSAWRLNEAHVSNFRMDAVTPLDLEPSGERDAFRYPVLVDANNNFLTEEKARNIEAYVRAGGTFVAMFETGRHSEERPDQWLLSGLTGCSCVTRAAYNLKPDAKGVVRVVSDDRWVWRPVVTNSVFALSPETRRQIRSDGAKFRADAADVEPLAYWDDGTLAVATRKVGKGRVVLWGVRFPAPYGTFESQVFRDLLHGLGVKDEPNAPRKWEGYLTAHFVTTDGLEDIWYVFSRSWDKKLPYRWTFNDGKPRALTDVFTGQPAAPGGELEPMGFAVATSLRQEDGEATWRWLTNEYGWWRGAGWARKDLADATVLSHPDVLDLGDGWTLYETNRAPRTVEMRQFVRGRDVHSDAFRLERDVTVPADWTNGTVSVWCTAQYASIWTCAKTRLSVDGVTTNSVWSRCWGPAGQILDVEPGKTYRMAVDYKDCEHIKLAGFGGQLFLYYRPHPDAVQDLHGAWEAWKTLTEPHPEALDYPCQLPRGKGVKALRKTFAVDSAAHGKRVFVDVDFISNGAVKIVINGHYLRRHHHAFGNRTTLDVTPWINFDGENELFLVLNYPQDRVRLAAARLAFRACDRGGTVNDSVRLRQENEK